MIYANQNVIIRKKNTSWELTEYTWFQGKCAFWKKMFDINKIPSIPIKIIYLYKLQYRDVIKDFGRFPRKHSWWCHFSIKRLLWTVSLQFFLKKDSFLEVFSLKIFKNGWLWTAASEQFKIASFDLFQFLI